MPPRIAEIFVLLASLLKWFLLASGVGAMVACSTALFLTALEASLGLVQPFPYAFLLLPIGLMLSGWITTSLSPEAEGQGTDRVIHAIHHQAGKINPTVIPAKLVATILTITAGGSAGSIGPCAQIGGGLCSLFANAVKFDEVDRKKLVICGISAGFASVFGTPIAGALFAAEVLFVGRFFYSVLFPSVIAAVVGFQVASALGVTYLTSPLHPLSQFSPSLFFFVGLSGMAFGFIALVFVEILQVGRRLASQTRLSGPLKGLLGGMVLLGVALAFSDQFLGLGFVTLHQALQGSTVIWYAFLLKILTTSLTLNFGGSGGIVLPLFFVGATSGSLFAEVLGLDLGMFAALGMVSVLAGAVNIPITSIVLAMELFGPSIAPYAAITCVMSFLLTGHRSVIPTQILEETKCSSIQVEKGQEVGQVMPSVQIRNKTLTKLVVSTFLRWRNPKQKTEP